MTASALPVDRGSRLGDAGVLATVLLVSSIGFIRLPAAVEEIIRDPSLPNEPIATVWTIRGAGNPLMRISTSCGCTLVEAPPAGTVIPVQGLPVTLRTTFAVSGDHVFSAAAFGADPVAPIDQISYRITVTDLIGFEGRESPWSKLVLARQPGGSWSGMRRFTRGRHPAPWSELTAEPVAQESGPAWRAAVVQHGQSWDLQVGLDPGRCCGVWSNRVTCRFSRADGTLLPYTPSLKAVATLPGPVAAIPSSVVIGGIEPGASATAKLVLRSPAGWVGVPLRWREDEPRDGTTVAVAWSEAVVHQDGSRQWPVSITIAVAAGHPVGQIGGGVVVTFSDGTTVRIPYLAAAIAIPP